MVKITMLSLRIWCLGRKILSRRPLVLMKVKVAQSCPALWILLARILEWVAVLFSRESSQPRDQTQVSRIAGGFFTGWATREAQGDSISLLFCLLGDAESNFRHWIFPPGSDRHPSTAAGSLRGFPYNLLSQFGWKWSHPDSCHLWSKTSFSYVFFPGQPVMSRFLLFHGDSAKDAGELPLYTQSNFFLGMHKPASFLPLSG